MRRGRDVLMTAFFVAVFALTGCAINPEARIHVAMMATFMDDDPDRNVDDGLVGYHLGVGKSLGDQYKLEVTSVGSRMNSDGFDADQDQNGFGLDIIRKLGSSDHFYPYAVVGMGHLRTRRDAVGARDYNGPFVTAGFGLITPLHIMGQAVRIEVRMRNDSGDTAGELYQDFLLNFGLHLPMGKAAPLSADTDNDGIPDSRDQCDGTRSGARVDRYGCAREEDSDQDGISDAIDLCGGSPAGSKVDEFGCVRIHDSDSDGVRDLNDDCPNTPPGARVDSKGCPVDSTARTTVQGMGESVVENVIFPSWMPRQPQDSQISNPQNQSGSSEIVASNLSTPAFFTISMSFLAPSRWPSAQFSGAVTVGL